MVDWVLELLIYHSYRRDLVNINCHGSGEKLHNVLLWGLASYISAQKEGLEGPIHYPSGKMPNLTNSYLFLLRAAG